MELLEEALSKESAGFNEWSLNVANIVGIIGHIVEVYTFSALAFTQEVGWDGNSDTFS